MAEPRVAVVVLNYNGREITLQALASLVRQSYPCYDVLVVDNGSTDGSHEAIRAAFPGVHRLRVERNRGVAGGYNLGMCWAWRRGHDYLLMLNNDIEAHADLVRELVRVAESNPRIGAVGPKTYYFWERTRLWSAGGIIRFRESVTRERGDGEIDRGQYDRDQEVGYVNGNGMMIRRGALEATGLWDPVYRFGVEDADFCMRLRSRGFLIHYAHRAVLYHMVSYSTGSYKAARTFETGRGGAIFVRRYARSWQWLTFLAFTLVALPAAWLRELRRGNQRAAVAKGRGVVDGLRIAIPSPPALASGCEGVLAEDGA